MEITQREDQAVDVEESREAGLLERSDRGQALRGNPVTREEVPVGQVVGRVCRGGEFPVDNARHTTIVDDDVSRREVAVDEPSGQGLPLGCLEHGLVRSQDERRVQLRHACGSEELVAWLETRTKPCVPVGRGAHPPIVQQSPTHDGDRPDSIKCGGEILDDQVHLVFATGVAPQGGARESLGNHDRPQHAIELHVVNHENARNRSAGFGRSTDGTVFPPVPLGPRSDANDNVRVCFDADEVDLVRNALPDSSDRNRSQSRGAAGNLADRARLHPGRVSGLDVALELLTILQPLDPRSTGPAARRELQVLTFVASCHHRPVVSQAEQLAEVCRRAGATVVSSIEWKRPVWIVDSGGQRAVLHRHAAYRTFPDLCWEFDALDQMADRIAAVAHPVRAFEGAAVVDLYGSVWTLQSLLAGEAVGWESSVDTARVGALIARFHDATSDIILPARPVAPTPMRRLVDDSSWSLFESQTRADAAEWFHDMRGRILTALDRAGVFGMPARLIHGDPTVFNVLADDGEPSGLVDFALCGVEVRVLDLAYAAWAWARDTFEAEALDVHRLERLVAGYHAISPLDAAAPSWFPDAMLARALQLVARWLPRQPPVDLTPTLARLQFLDARRDEVRSAVARAISSTSVR